MFKHIGFPAVQNWTSTLIPVTCTLVSPCIIDLRGNNGFILLQTLQQEKIVLLHYLVDQVVIF